MSQVNPTSTPTHTFTPWTAVISLICPSRRLQRFLFYRKDTSRSWFRNANHPKNRSALKKRASESSVKMCSDRKKKYKGCFDMLVFSAYGKKPRHVNFIVDKKWIIDIYLNRPWCNGLLIPCICAPGGDTGRVLMVHWALSPLDCTVKERKTDRHEQSRDSSTSTQ